MKNVRSHLRDWGAAYLTVAILLYGIAARRTLLIVGSSALLVLLGAFTTVLAVRGRRLKGSDPAILSSPLLAEMAPGVTSQSLADLGLRVRTLEGTDFSAATELELLEDVLEIPASSADLKPALSHLSQISRGAVSRSTLAAATQGLEAFEPEVLLALNSRIEPALGQFYYYPADDLLQIVFLTSKQVEVLAERGWKFHSAVHRLRNAA